MKRVLKSTATTAILGALALAAVPVLAGAAQTNAPAPSQQAGMATHGAGMGSQGMQGKGMKGGAMKGAGKMGAMKGGSMKGGSMMSSMKGGAMKGGMMGAMMRHMMGGQGMAGQGMGGQGMAGLAFGGRVTPTTHLSVDDVRHFFEHRLERSGHKRLKVGEVKKAGKDAITADIVTVDDSLVERFKVDRHTGKLEQTD